MPEEDLGEFHDRGSSAGQQEVAGVDRICRVTEWPEHLDVMRLAAARPAHHVEQALAAVADGAKCNFRVRTCEGHAPGHGASRRLGGDRTFKAVGGAEYEHGR